MNPDARTARHYASIVILDAHVSKNRYDRADVPCDSKSLGASLCTMAEEHDVLVFTPDALRRYVLAMIHEAHHVPAMETDA